MLGTPDTEVVTALGPGMPISERLPMVIARRKAAKAEYIAILDWYQEQPVLKSVRLVGNTVQLVWAGKTTTIPLDGKN